MNKQIKERGIIFNGEMVRAILDGSKTQTRRVVKLQPESNQHGICIVTESGIKSEEGKFFWSEFNATGHKSRSPLFSCPFGKVGDRLWIRETWSMSECFDDCKPSELSPILDINYLEDGFKGDGKARPSSQMPRWASRITLEITDIRVERLRAISESDAVKEGVPPAGDLLPNYPDTYLTPKGDFATAKVAFQRLWELIYGQDSWQSNPFVWVVEFKRVEAA